MNTIKCCYNKCKNESIGYFETSSSGLWLCNSCKYGTLQTPIEEIKQNPNKYKHLINM